MSTSLRRAVSLGALFLLAVAACGNDAGAPGASSSSSGGPVPGGPGGDASTPGDAGGPSEPDPEGPSVPANIVFVLTDDLSWNLVEHMPNVKAMQAEGVTFDDYFVTDSLCCPSRASIFTGMFPHNTGVFTNEGDDGGYTAFKKNGNETRTFATTLSAAGYETGFMGKYMNKYLPTMPVPPGWTHWAATGNGYAEYDYTLNVDGKTVDYAAAEADYLTDVLSRRGVRFVEGVAKKNFVLELASFAPHGAVGGGTIGAVPAPRHANLYPGLKAPRTQAFGARPGATAPAWLKKIPALDQAAEDRIDRVFRTRAQSVKAVDEMIGAIRASLRATGRDKNTYVVFSSDNGFHLGEHSLRSGKLTAFDTDIRVPLIVVGPGVPAGKVVHEVAQNVDLCPTFAEMGKTAPPATADGHSLLALMRGKAVTDWRTAILVEHHGDDFVDPGDPDAQDEGAGNPTTYAALRTQSLLYVEYANGDREYHDHATDPNELTNTFEALPAAKQKRLHDAVVAMQACKGDAQCWAAQHVAP